MLVFVVSIFENTDSKESIITRLGKFWLCTQNVNAIKKRLIKNFIVRETGIFLTMQK